MKMQYLIPIIALMLIVSVSGCIDGFDLSMLGMGGGGTTEMESPDLITMEEVSIWPNPPIIAGNDFTVLFKMKNQDNSETVDNVEVKLYDWGICTPLADDFLPVDSDLGWMGVPAENSKYYVQTFDEVYPNEEKVIEFRFKSPDNEKIANIQTVCPIKWEVNYTFSSKSNDDFTVISQTRNRELQRSDTSWSGTNQPQFIGIGPVKIQYAFKTEMPVQTNGSIQFTLQVFDKGQGIYSKVKEGTMFVKVPLEWLPRNSDGEINVAEANEACTRTFAPGITGNIIADEGLLFLLAGEEVAIGNTLDPDPINAVSIDRDTGITFDFVAVGLNKIARMELVTTDGDSGSSLLVRITDDVGESLMTKGFTLETVEEGNIFADVKSGTQTINFGEEIPLEEGKTYTITLSRSGTMSTATFLAGNNGNVYYKLYGTESVEEEIEDETTDDTADDTTDDTADDTTDVTLPTNIEDFVIEDTYAVYVNIKDINLYDRETHEIICRFKAPDLDVDNIPEKTYFLMANITDYSYRLTEDQSVRIEPMI